LSALWATRICCFSGAVASTWLFTRKAVRT